MAELFIEIGVEEMPVAEINPAIEHLSNTLSVLFKNDGINFDSCETYSAPRRLAVCFKGLSDKGKPDITTYTGPRKEAAFDKNGNPTQAAIGFARSKGVDVKSLKVVKLDKGEFVQVEIKKQGVLTKNLVKQKLAGVILGIPFRKSMRWDSESIRFIRPIRWLVVLYNGKIVPITIGDVKASAYTYGLRTGGVKRIKVTGFDSCIRTMKKGKILPGFDARRESIKKQADNFIKKVHGKAAADIELLDTIANLTESPSAIMGKFDKRFMNLPEEVIMSVMKTQQKYIPVVDKKSALMPYFIGISNNPYGDKTVIRKGYARVLRARLEDAEFYYHQDIKQPLEAYIDLLKGMVYNPALGSLYDKTQRIRAVSSFIADTINTNEQTRATILKAAELCKADLSTRLVSEFPELQGIIGRHYIQLKDPAFKPVAAAVYEHSSKEIPQTLPGSVVSIADKIDTLTGFFSIGEIPTGTQDPYGLRRAAIGIINVVLNGRIELDVRELIKFNMDQYKQITVKKVLGGQVLDYIYGRLVGILRERHYTELSLEAAIQSKANPIDMLINAVIAAGPGNIVDIDEKINAFKDVLFKPGFEPVFLAFKRVINISKNHSAGEVNVEMLMEPSEKALYDRWLAVEPEVQSALAKRDYIGYIKSLKKIVPEINTFFDKVLVMSDDENIRNNRLNLLAKIKYLTAQVMDITKLI